MSYILDALKKAERERGIAQVPTITTMHDLRAMPRIRLWAVCGLVILCVSAALWFFFYSPRTHIGPAAPRNGADRVPSQHEAQRIEESMPAEGPPLAVAPQESPKPVLTSQIPARNPKVGPSAAATSQVEAAAGLSGVAVPKPAVKEPPRIPAAQALVQPQPGAQSDSVEEKEAAPVAAQPKPNSLREAMAGMTISVHVFSEDKAERLVFINGKKYVEGDYVEGSYLLESITPEGAVLSYQGARALLRPGAK
jgi:general secretion pathway protein B